MSPPAWKVWNFGREGKALSALPLADRRSPNSNTVELASRCEFSQRYGVLETQDSAATFFQLAKSMMEGEHHCCRPNQGPSSKQGGGDGTRRQKSPRSTVHRAGGPFPKRKNHTLGSDNGADGRHPARRQRRCRNVSGRSYSRSAAPQDGRRPYRCYHTFYGRQLHFYRL